MWYFSYYFLLFWIGWASLDIQGTVLAMDGLQIASQTKMLKELEEIKSKLYRNKIEDEKKFKEILNNLTLEQKKLLTSILKKKFISFFMNYSLNLNLKYYLQKHLEKNSQKKIFLSQKDNDMILDFKEYLHDNNQEKNKNKKNFKLIIKEDGNIEIIYYGEKISYNTQASETAKISLIQKIKLKNKRINKSEFNKNFKLISKVLNLLDEFVSKSKEILKSQGIVFDNLNRDSNNSHDKIALILLYSSLRFNIKYDLEKCLFGAEYNRNRNTNKKFHSSHDENNEKIKLDLSTYFYSNSNPKVELIIDYSKLSDTIYLNITKSNTSNIIKLVKKENNGKLSLSSNLNDNILNDIINKKKVEDFVECLNKFIQKIYNEIKFDRLLSGGSKIKSKNKILKEDLIKLCKKYELKNYSSLKKDELIKLLKKNKKM